MNGHQDYFLRGEPEMERIILHWTGGAHGASQEDLTHYHRLIQGDGTVVTGTHGITDNVVTSDGDYAAHTLRLNTGSIGVAMCGMHDATATPFDPGPYPITVAQFAAAAKEIARLCLTHGIKVSPETVLTHAEVGETLGVPQRGKWDVTRLPWLPGIKGAREIGDILRAAVEEYDRRTLHLDERQRANLTYGDWGRAVADLQTDLAALGYHSGAIDGQFGQLTRASVLAFQADNGLGTDGVVGALTRKALKEAQPRAPRALSLSDIDAGSGTAQDALIAQRAGGVVGLGGAALAAAEIREVLHSVSGLSDLVRDNWPTLALAALCVVAWFAITAATRSIRLRRLADAREHRSLSL